MSKIQFEKKEKAASQAGWILRRKLGVEIHTSRNRRIYVKGAKL